MKKQITYIFFCLLIACTLTSGAAHAQQIFFDGFEGATSCAPQPQCWTVALPGGAQGSGQIVQTIFAAGKASYQIQKSNAVGYVDVALNESFTLQPGNTYTFHLSYHSSNAPLSALLLIRLGQSSDPNLGYDTSADFSEGYESQGLIRNSTATWFDRLMDTTVPTDAKPRTVTPHVVLYGNPSTVYIDNFEIVANNPGFSNAAGPPFATTATAAQVTTTLAARPDTTAALGTYNGHPVLSVNGAPVPPLLYKALLSQKTVSGGYDTQTVGDYAGFHTAGLDTVVMAAPLNYGPGQFLPTAASWTGMNGTVPVMDFTSLDANLLALLEKNPYANIILDLWVYPNQQWLQANAASESFSVNGSTWASDGSLQWRGDAANAIAALVNHVRTGPYHKAVMGWFLTAGVDGQETQFVDVFDASAANTLAFQAWLQQTYQNIGTLNQTWQTAYPSFSAISIPAYPGVEPLPTITGPSALSCFLAFRREQSWALRDSWAGIIKAAAGKSVVVLTYAAPLDQGFVQSKYIDGAGMQSPYQYRASGLPDGFKPISPDSLHGKILFSELDLRSWVAASGSELDRAWTPIPDNINEWREENRKLIGGALADGFGAWYYDMDQYFNDPTLMTEIGVAVQAWKQALQAKKVSFRPDVCVVIADDAFDYVTGAQSPIDGAILGLMQLQTSGVPFDVQYISDVLSNTQLQQYKVYVFWHLARLTAAQRTAIAKFAQTPRTLVWEYDTGFVSDYGIDPVAMDTTIGMNIATTDTYLRQTPILLSAPLTNGLLPFQSMSELELSKFRLDLSSADNQGAEGIMARSRSFSVNDSQATPLAQFDGYPGSVAIASKKLGAANSIYIASPYGLGGDLMHALAVQAGAYVAGAPGPAIHMNGEFMSLHAMTSGAYLIALPPGKHTVVDAITGATLSSGSTSYKLLAQPQTTYWLRFE
jgi:hypothetical protein